MPFPSRVPTRTQGCIFCVFLLSVVVFFNYYNNVLCVTLGDGCGFFFVAVFGNYFRKVAAGAVFLVAVSPHCRKWLYQRQPRIRWPFEIYTDLTGTPSLCFVIEDQLRF